MTTPFGLFEYLLMSFGLHYVAQIFQRFMDKVMSGLDFVEVYIDDNLVAYSSPKQHEGPWPPSGISSQTAP